MSEETEEAETTPEEEIMLEEERLEKRVLKHLGEADNSFVNSAGGVWNT